MQAIIATGGKQYKVQSGDVIYIEKLSNEANDIITFDKVLSLVDGQASTFGAPYIDGAQVIAKVIKSGKAKKINIFKYNAKKNYRRRQGHRQSYTKLQVERIVTP